MLRACVWMTWRAGEGTWVPVSVCVCMWVSMHLCTYRLLLCVCGSVQMWSDVFFSLTKGATFGHPVSLQHKQGYFWTLIICALRQKFPNLLINLHIVMLSGLMITILCLFISAHTLKGFLLDTFPLWVHGFKLAWFYQLFREQKIIEFQTIWKVIAQFQTNHRRALCAM